MTASSLTIGQLAAHAGVTVRAVRHYHARGLLPEPPRDASGYRRYDAQAVVNLIRIKTLADAGVPLARIGQLLDADPAEFRDAITSIDRALQAKIRQLQTNRRQVAQLAQGERLFLPADLVGILERLRALGISEFTVRMERDGWILLTALAPHLVAGWAAEKSAALDDPEFRELYLSIDQAREWDPSDPRLEALVSRAENWMSRHQRGTTPAPEPNAKLSIATNLIAAQFAVASPSLQRLSDMVDRD